MKTTIIKFGELTFYEQSGVFFVTDVSADGNDCRFSDNNPFIAENVFFYRLQQKVTISCQNYCKKHNRNPYTGEIEIYQY